MHAPYDTAVHAALQFMTDEFVCVHVGRSTTELALLLVHTLYHDLQWEAGHMKHLADLCSRNSMMMARMIGLREYLDTPGTAAAQTGVACAMMALAHLSCTTSRRCNDFDWHLLRRHAMGWTVTQDDLVVVFEWSIFAQLQFRVRQERLLYALCEASSVHDVIQSPVRMQVFHSMVLSCYIKPNPTISHHLVDARSKLVLACVYAAQLHGSDEVLMDGVENLAGISPRGMTSIIRVGGKLDMSMSESIAYTPVIQLAEVVALHWAEIGGERTTRGKGVALAEADDFHGMMDS
jgi:hypothetical protein